MTLANAEIKKLTLTLNILTAFIRLGRAGPDRGRVPSILLFDVPVPLIFYFLIMLAHGFAIYYIDTITAFR